MRGQFRDWHAVTVWASEPLKSASPSKTDFNFTPRSSSIAVAVVVSWDDIAVLLLLHALRHQAPECSFEVNDALSHSRQLRLLLVESRCHALHLCERLEGRALEVGCGEIREGLGDRLQSPHRRESWWLHWLGAWNATRAVGCWAAVRSCVLRRGCWAAVRSCVLRGGCHRRGESLILWAGGLWRCPAARGAVCVRVLAVAIEAWRSSWSFLLLPPFV